MIRNVFFLIAAIFVFALGCAKSENHNNSTKQRYVPLSLEESKKLITPTVYYIPVYDQTTLACADRKSIRDTKGITIATVCKNVFDSCVMQGTCQIRQGAESTLVNVSSVVQSERRFSVLKSNVCKFGTGSTKGQNTKPICLDPYYSVAADLSLYAVGTVIYIPSVVGTAMPDGTLHDGYFVVRDSGSAIKGYGRFDFFTGFSLNRSESPLVQLGFGDKQTNVPYYIVASPQTDEILKKRNYPELPVNK